jgi:hypothetical protein
MPEDARRACRARGGPDLLAHHARIVAWRPTLIADASQEPRDQVE